VWPSTILIGLCFSIQIASRCTLSRSVNNHEDVTVHRDSHPISQPCLLAWKLSTTPYRPFIIVCSSVRISARRYGITRTCYGRVTSLCQTIWHWESDRVVRGPGIGGVHVVQCCISSCTARTPAILLLGKARRIVLVWLLTILILLCCSCQVQVVSVCTLSRGSTKTLGSDC
jgi:hypothetical protein